MTNPSFAGRNARLREIRESIRAWGLRNFPDQTPVACVMGVTEEVGEFSDALVELALMRISGRVGAIAHGLLKMRQGIRGTREQHLAAIKDAIGDGLVFTVDYTNRSGLDRLPNLYSPAAYAAQDYEVGAALRGDGGPLLVDLYLELRAAAAERALAPDAAFAFAVGMVNALGRVAAGFGWDLLDVLEETWAQVVQRDWVADREAGGEATATVVPPGPGALPKLIRPGVISAILAEGKTPRTRQVAGQELHRFLLRKLHEEAAELVACPFDGGADGAIEELADLYQVLDDIALVMHIGSDAVRRLRRFKRDNLGDFRDGVVLDAIADNDEKLGAT